VTRRGYGDSSKPKDDYDADRLGDDVVAVIQKLNIHKPILMGHSFGGQEVSDVATRYPQWIAGAIYLDAIYSYDTATEKEALYWNVEWRQQIEALQKHLTELLESSFDSRPLAKVNKTPPAPDPSSSATQSRLELEPASATPILPLARAGSPTAEAPA
jgi:pimeloyl-ACP methyl ester carboxylesterase